MALEILSLQTNIMQYSSYNEREIAIRETLYWVGLKYVLQTLDAIRYLCQQLQDILEDMEGILEINYGLSVTSGSCLSIPHTTLQTS